MSAGPAGRSAPTDAPGLARLTPSFREKAARSGAVHSVFTRVTNLAFAAEGGPRLIALVAPGALRLPDSICALPALLLRLEAGMPARLGPDFLQLAGSRLPLRPDLNWDGLIRSRACAPRRAEFLAAAAGIRCALDDLPQALRRRAERAIVRGGEKLWGLGRGLTPAFDDACIGAMAIYRAFGRPAPFRPDLSATTDISARYLRLAAEGYFGEAVLDVVDALCGEGDMEKSVCALARVGATSGSDMLRGMVLAVKEMT
jgi:hypothetical protein